MIKNSLSTDIKLHRSTTASFELRLKTVLFNRGFAEHVLHFRSFSRKRIINTLVTVTVTEHKWSNAAALNFNNTDNHFKLQSAYVKCVKIFLDIVSFIVLP